MISTLSIPKVLFIKGVFKRDCDNDETLEQKMIENISDDISDIVMKDSIAMSENTEFYDRTYDKLPSIFDSIDNWPTTTNLLCWSCNLHFDTIPIFIPKVIEPVISKHKENKYSIGVFGVFCTFGCAWHFIHEHQFSLIERVEAINKLKFLHKLLKGTSMKDIVTYPSPFEMEQYGGDLSIEKYKELINHYGL